MKTRSSLLAILLLAGCGGAPTTDAGVDAPRTDSGALDVGSADTGAAEDAGPAEDAGDVDGGDVDGGDVDGGGVDTGTAVAIAYRDGEATLPRALYGYQRTSGVITGVYLELSIGGTDECPSKTSPVPDQIVTISGFEGSEPGTDDTDIEVQFFDFVGTFFEEIAPRIATEASVTFTELDEAGGPAAGTVEITFDEGSASGPFVALHCDSLDAAD